MEEEEEVNTYPDKNRANIKNSIYPRVSERICAYMHAYEGRTNEWKIGVEARKRRRRSKNWNCMSVAIKNRTTAAAAGCFQYFFCVVNQKMNEKV